MSDRIQLERVCFIDICGSNRILAQFKYLRYHMFVAIVKRSQDSMNAFLKMAISIEFPDFFPGHDQFSIEAFQYRPSATLQNCYALIGIPIQR